MFAVHLLGQLFAEPIDVEKTWRIVKETMFKLAVLLLGQLFAAPIDVQQT